MVHGPARAALGIVAGIGAYQILTQSMHLYEQRARGIIDVGMRLNLQFDQTGQTIDRLRSRYAVLAHDSIEAMQTFGRYTGQGGGSALDAAVGFGAAYGISAPQAAALAGPMQQLTTGSHPLRRFAAGARGPGGELPGGMAMETLLEEGPRMAAVGGTAAVSPSADFLGRMAGFIGGMGPRYRVPGAISGFYEQFSQGISQTQDPTTQMFRLRAIQQLGAQRQQAGLGPLTIGRGEDRETLDLNTFLGQIKALEMARQTPQIMEAYRQQALQLAGSNPQLAEIEFQRLVGSGLSPVQSGRLMRRAQAVGGFEQLGQEGDIGREQRLEGGRLQAREGRREFDIQRREAATERPMEIMGEPFLRAALNLREEIAKLGGAAADGTLSLTSLTGAIAGLEEPTKRLVGILTTLGADTTLGKLVGVGLTLSGFEQQANTATKNLVERFPFLGIGSDTMDWLANALRQRLGLQPLKPRP